MDASLPALVAMPAGEDGVKSLFIAHRMHWQDNKVSCKVIGVTYFESVKSQRCCDQTVLWIGHNGGAREVEELISTGA